MNKTLFWRLFTPVIGIFIIGMAFIAWYIPVIVRENAEREAIATAQRTVSQFKTLRAYYTKNVISKVVANGAMKGSFNHKSEPNSIPLPATMIHDLSELLRQKGTSLSLYSGFPFPNRASRKMDQFEKNAWAALTRNPDTVFTRTQIHDGKTTVRVGLADRMVAAGCVSCHNTRINTPKNDWKLGDVRGVLEVETSIDEQLANGQQISNYVVGMLVILLLVIFGGLMISYRVTIGNALKSVIAALSNIADGDGDLTRRLNDSGEHEVAQICQAFNRFVAKIQETVSAVIPVSDELATASQHLGELSRSTNNAIELQERETEQVAAACNELTATAHEISSNCNHVANATQKTEQATQSGQVLVTKSIDSTAQLPRDVQSASQALVEFQKDSENITGVLDVIKGVAEQTNLLALNAAIEAARAGEQGRGFAVVADEVRTLAGRTQESTQEIHEMVISLKSATATMVDVIGKSNEQAESTVELAKEVGSHLAEITDEVAALSNMNTQIITAVGQQSQAVSDVDGNLNKISEMSQTTAEDSRRTNDHVETMTKLATHLKQLAGQFRV